jgi:large subunit ribosomal protein L18
MAIKAKKIRHDARTRSKYRIRKKIYGTEDKPRASIFKSGKHTYAQVILDNQEKTLVSASTLDKEVIDSISSVAKESVHNDARSTKSVAAAHAVGLVLAKRCLEKNISRVVFDRNGFVYKGRVRAVADGARAGGLQF